MKPNYIKIIAHLMGASLSALIFIPTLSYAEDVGQSDKKSPAAINWKPCFTNENPNLLCAQYPVPLDYQADRGKNKNIETINIALIKIPANNPNKQKLGSLFLNPGGPGGSGFLFVRYVGQYLFSQDVRDQYDLIGFDPRGINYSSPASCGLDLSQLFSDYSGSGYFPVTKEEEKATIELNNKISAVCGKNGNAIMDHMATADVARDLDLLREAAGEKLLNFVGYSYGSYIGITYANLFPQNVGRFVVDGVLDPIQWSTGKGFSGWITPVTTRVGSDKSSYATLKEFFRLCDLAGTSGCSFSGNSEARFDAMAQALKTHSRMIELPGSIFIELTYAALVSNALYGMYSISNWNDLANLLTSIEGNFSAKVIGENYSKFVMNMDVEPAMPPGDNLLIAFPSVLCSDSTNPVDINWWPLWASESEKNNGYFGRYWTWPSSGCAQWSHSQRSRFTGPFNQKTKNPVLVANTVFDPATPYAGAQTVSRLLPNSRLLTVAGWGHTTPGLSSCADNITESYLLRGDLPDIGTVCKQDVMPFVMPNGADVFAGSDAALGAFDDDGHQYHEGKKGIRNIIDDHSKDIRKLIMRIQHGHH